MPLPSSGKITTQTFRDFFEISSSTPINSSDWYRGGPYVRANYQSVNGNVSINNQVPTSGRIALSDLYGAYKVVPANNTAPGNPAYPDATVDPGQFPDTSSDVTESDPFANPPQTLNSSDVGNNPPNPDWGAGPAGANQDPNGSSPDLGGVPGTVDPHPANLNPTTGNSNYTYYTPGNTNSPTNNPGNPSDPGQFGNGDLNPGGTTPGNPNPGNWTYADPKTPGNYNQNNSDVGNGPSNPQDYTPTPPTGPDSSAAPSVRDSYYNPNNTTNAWNATTNPPTWINHEKLV